MVKDRFVKVKFGRLVGCGLEIFCCYLNLKDICHEGMKALCCRLDRCTDRQIDRQTDRQAIYVFDRTNRQTDNGLGGAGSSQIRITSMRVFLSSHLHIIHLNQRKERK